MAESALVALVPEAEPLVSSFRTAYDPVAVRGMQAHITILYPFKNPDRIDRVVLHMLRDHFSSQKEFEFSLVSVAQFPEVLYLVPEPSISFLSLTDGLGGVFPDMPPYGGVFAEPIPHLTVAKVIDPAELNTIANRFIGHAAEKLPIMASLSVITLMEEREGHWHLREEFPLGDAISNSAL